MTTTDPIAQAFETLVEAINAPHWPEHPVFQDEITRAAFLLVVAAGRRKAGEEI